MQQPNPRRHPTGYAPLRAVVDACVLAKKDRMRQLLLDAKDGFVILIWSSHIAYEWGTVYMRLVQKRFPTEPAAADRRAISEAGHRYVRELSATLQVVEDGPPDEEMWSNQPPDEWDVHLWNAARRAQARYIVTENLRDGPPPNADGIRLYLGVVWIHPDQFVKLVAWWAEFVASAAVAPSRTDSEPGPDMPTYSSRDFEKPELPPALTQFLLELEAGARLNPSQPPPRQQETKQ